MFNNINNKDDLIDELASEFDCIDPASDLFIDLTAQSIGFSVADSLADGPDIWRQLDGHEIVYLEAVSSR